MHWDVTEVLVASPWTQAVGFADGLAGTVRFRSGFFTGVFAPLRDGARFAEAYVDGGADRRCSGVRRGVRRSFGPGGRAA
jgi:hypothetical protein